MFKLLGQFVVACVGVELGFRGYMWMKERMKG